MTRSGSKKPELLLLPTGRREKRVWQDSIIDSAVSQGYTLQYIKLYMTGLTFFSGSHKELLKMEFQLVHINLLHANIASCSIFKFKKNDKPPR